MTDCVAIIVRSEQKALYASIGLLLAKHVPVKFVVDNRDSATVIQRIFAPDSPPTTLIEPDFRLCPRVTPNTELDALRREQRYQICYANLIGMDRALGRAYLTNVERYPWIGRANWANEEKLESLNRRFTFFENALDDCSLLISQYPEPIPTLVSEYKGIKHLHLLQARFGDRMIWDDSGSFASESYVDALKKYLLTIDSEDKDRSGHPMMYQPDATGRARLVRALDKFSFTSLVKHLLTYVLRRTMLFLIGRGKSNSYTFLAWAPVIIRRYFHYHRINQTGKTPSDLVSRNIYYFPLHLEPEIMLLLFSPEFNNSFEAISWVSRSLPADSILVVKEHPKSLGHRDTAFYRQLQAMGNVVLSAPDIPSQEWITAAKAVVTIAGTVAEEAVHMNTPVVVFGRRQIVNFLPTVFLVKSYEEVANAIAQITNPGFTDFELDRSRYALGKATMEISFDLPGYSASFKSTTIDLERSKIALTELMKRFPSLLDIHELP
jgi:hypothetical protein